MDVNVNERAISAAVNKLYSVKYYKGLGTNTPEEGKQYFQKLNMHRKLFYDEGSAGDAIDLAFSKHRVEDRRAWLSSSFDADSFIDPNQPNVSFEEFINKELIQFSASDHRRSIPSAIDGLKPSQRKVLFACFKRNVVTDLKLVQLAGYVAEKTSYHHGEASLHATIIKMAQDFVGSNNFPLLVPSGQFGTRAQGGTDFASPRYIFTRLAPIARALFPEADDAHLQHLEEDGISVEPRYYLPVVPALLLNGSNGIGMEAMANNC
jgi:DNA topoisomerase-2